MKVSMWEGGGGEYTCLSFYIIFTSLAKICSKIPRLTTLDNDCAQHLNKLTNMRACLKQKQWNKAFTCPHGKMHKCHVNSCSEAVTLVIIQESNAVSSENIHGAFSFEALLSDESCRGKLHLRSWFRAALLDVSITAIRGFVLGRRLIRCRLLTVVPLSPPLDVNSMPQVVTTKNVPRCCLDISKSSPVENHGY